MYYWKVSSISPIKKMEFLRHHTLMSSAFLWPLKYIRIQTHYAHLSYLKLFQICISRHVHIKFIMTNFIQNFAQLLQVSWAYYCFCFMKNIFLNTPPMNSTRGSAADLTGMFWVAPGLNFFLVSQIKKQSNWTVICF